MSQRPHVVRTWAPKGQTPILHHAGHWKRLSVAGGITFTEIYFRLYPGSVNDGKLINFLGALRRQIGKKLLIVWDNLPAHRSKRMKRWLAKRGEDFLVEHLPAYAPELNPVEYLWGWWKGKALPNFAAQTEWELHHFARRGLRQAQRKQTLIAAFWKQAELRF